MAYPIETAGCIGPVMADRLRDLGIATTDALLARARDPAARRDLAAATGMDAGLVLRCAHRCDLFRVHGISRVMAEFLEAAGVATVADLAARAPGRLAAALGRINRDGASGLVTPGERVVAGSIARAADLRVAVLHHPAPACA
ncbi:hypothetical protein OPKNFCMD_1555 [Methylobacterium crusticola]|uniref:DUF4332 domain-containing protein n=1 Tax=Methylobacterium crusticola TaxID=1697972 RepID=A0ABQ4QVW9_9HYPH|nr:DUF4332 domain-containing protein [Methylobacterium crusticola]GJD48829.1 hypothetical protein OPKNFCMD_1555 [Methylobacterium crusticola]